MEERRLVDTSKAAISPTGSFCSIVSILMCGGLQLSVRRFIPLWKMFVFVTMRCSTSHTDLKKKGQK